HRRDTADTHSPRVITFATICPYLPAWSPAGSRTTAPPVRLRHRRRLGRVLAPHRLRRRRRRLRGRTGLLGRDRLVLDVGFRRPGPRRVRRGRPRPQLLRGVLGVRARPRPRGEGHAAADTAGAVHHADRQPRRQPDAGRAVRRQHHRGPRVAPAAAARAEDRLGDDRGRDRRLHRPRPGRRREPPLRRPGRAWASRALPAAAGRRRARVRGPVSVPRPGRHSALATARERRRNVARNVAVTATRTSSATASGRRTVEVTVEASVSASATDRDHCCTDADLAPGAKLPRSVSQTSAYSRPIVTALRLSTPSATNTAL